MTIETVTYEELKWKDAPLFAPNKSDQLAGMITEDETPIIESKLESKSVTIPLKAESTALLIVDVQPEYWTHCPSVRKDFPKFEENLKRTIDICRKKKAKIIWVRADYRYSTSPWLAQFERLNGGRRADTTAEVPCDQNSETFGWEDFATPEGNEVIIAKKSWNSASDTALMDYLRVSEIDNVLVCGLITSVCVQHSAFSVFEAGYRTCLVEDACGDRGIARHNAAIALYGNYMYEISSSKILQNENIGLQAAKPKWITRSSVNYDNNKRRKISSEENMGEETKTQKKIFFVDEPKD